MKRMVAVWNQSGNVRVAACVEIADTSLRRAAGLLGRKMLGPDHGLWIRPCSGVHTFGMCFSIDVIGLNKHGRVTKLWRNLKPHRMTALLLRVKSVIELPAESIDRCCIQIGDELRVEE